MLWSSWICQKALKIDPCSVLHDLTAKTRETSY